MSDVAHPDPYGFSTSGVVNVYDVFDAPVYDANGRLTAVEGYAMIWYNQRNEQTVGRTVIDKEGMLHTHSLTQSLTHSLTNTPLLVIFHLHQNSIQQLNKRRVFRERLHGVRTR